MDSISIVIGNICSLLAMGTDALSSTQKTSKRVLLVQSLSQLIYCFGTVVLKGYSGAVQNVVSIARNIVAIKGIQSKAVEWTLVILGVVLGLGFNNLGVMGLLPVIANFQYTLVVFRAQDNERLLKLSFLVTVVLFGLFNLAIYNVVGLCTNMFVAVSIVVNLLKPRKEA